jgi:heme a synthase
MTAPSAPTTASSPREPSAWRWLRWFALAAIVANVVIVFTGGVVRVSGSGLGCVDWPTCDGTNIAPTPGGEHAGWQAAVEFGNRLLTLPVLATAVAVFVQVRRTRPHTRTVETLAWALPLGVLAQALLGGITVLTGLSPYTVAAHFLLSMALIAWAVVLHERVRVQPPTPAPPRGIQHATTAILVVGAAVLLLGTIVTGAGPHGGDVDAPRFGVDIRLVAIAHADAVWLLIGTTVATVAATWRSGPARFRHAIRLLLLVQLLQGGIGYLQYWLGIPPTLVSLHILGAALMWTVAVTAWVRARPVSVLPPEAEAADAEVDTRAPAQ